MLFLKNIYKASIVMVKIRRWSVKTPDCGCQVSDPWNIVAYLDLGTPEAVFSLFQGNWYYVPAARSGDHKTVSVSALLISIVHLNCHRVSPDITAEYLHWRKYLIFNYYLHFADPFSLWHLSDFGRRFAKLYFHFYFFSHQWSNALHYRSFLNQFII